MQLHDYRRTKVVSTIGPASNSPEMIEKLIRAGVDVFRLNFSHGTYEQHKENIKNIRNISKKIKPSVGILLDLQGPKIRVGTVEDGGIFLKDGQIFNIQVTDCIGAGNTVSTSYKKLIEDVTIGDRILLDDGLLEVEVINIEKSTVVTKVIVGGILTSRKGINLPNVNLSIPALTEKDRQDLDFAIKNDIDFIALSFVRKPQDILDLLRVLEDHNKFIPVIAKIEKPEAVKNINEIIELAWGIMVARGDLGVELKVEEVPAIQKAIVKKCNKLGKQVIIATQMLDSMIRNPRPTRAEASDVANAVLDGADAVMLSGETAAGKYPIESVDTMVNIINKIEGRYFVKKEFKKKKLNRYPMHSVSDAVSYSAVNIAKNIDAKLICVITHTGKTARQIARFKSYHPILAITDDPKVPSKMALTWGVHCSLIDKIERTEECLSLIEEKIEESEFLENDDLIIITAGMPTLERNSTNMIKVHQVDRGNSELF